MNEYDILREESTYKLDKNHSCMDIDHFVRSFTYFLLIANEYAIDNTKIAKERKKKREKRIE